MVEISQGRQSSWATIASTAKCTMRGRTMQWTILKKIGGTQKTDLKSKTVFYKNASKDRGICVTWL